jgi:CheY-like chemotaxis protein
MSKLLLSILLVEDHLAIARQVLDFLDGLGWQTDHAGTGALAVQLAPSPLTPC